MELFNDTAPTVLLIIIHYGKERREGALIQEQRWATYMQLPQLSTPLRPT